jgi:hypothetical protein
MFVLDYQKIVALLTGLTVCPGEVLVRLQFLSYARAYS